MGGTELVYELFAECRTGGPNSNNNICVLDPGNFESTWPIVRAVLAAMVVKACLTVVTFGIKVPSGIFIPTLGVGACAGRLLGVAVKCLQWKYPDSQVFAVCKGDMDCVVPGLYAMVGGECLNLLCPTFPADWGTTSCCCPIRSYGEHILETKHLYVSHLATLSGRLYHWLSSCSS